jgi:ABC-type Fe3+-hydroxamate transport system substrate-binding protein
MPLFEDQLGRPLALATPPQRIISLVPSQTELLFDLGLHDQVVGITKFCVHPESWFRSKARVGGTKQLHHDKIRALHPDFILANREENRKEDVEQLAKEFNVWVSDVSNLPAAYEMIQQVGAITGTTGKATQITTEIAAAFGNLHMGTTTKAAYLIWKDPLMTIGSDTFIHDMMVRAGFQNVFADHQRYPETTYHELMNAGCEVLLLSSEPYPFSEKHLEAMQQQLPGVKLVLVDGEIFSWYGSRLRFAPAYFAELQKRIH